MPSRAVAPTRSPHEVRCPGGGATLARIALWTILACALATGCSSPPERHGSSGRTAIGPRDRLSLPKSLTFHASFDRGTDADFALGDPWLYHAPSLDRIPDARPGLPGGGVAEIESTGGRHGGSLNFKASSPAVIFFRAGGNLPWSPAAWSGTVSFWLRASPDHLAPGFCDPVNITPRAWDDAAFFVEFERRTNEVPFRLGAYADKSVWNPRGRNWNDIPASEKPLITIPGPPFSGDRWTHVAFTWDHYNTGQSDGTTILYLDGAQVGILRNRDQRFTWDPAAARLHLGVSYIGRLDDLAVFNRALDQSEIQHVRSLPRGVRSLYTRPNRVP